MEIQIPELSFQRKHSIFPASGQTRENQERLQRGGEAVGKLGLISFPGLVSSGVG